MCKGSGVGECMGKCMGKCFLEGVGVLIKSEELILSESEVGEIKKSP